MLALAGLWVVSSFTANALLSAGFIFRSPRYLIFVLIENVLLPIIIYKLISVLLFLVLNISTSLFYDLFSNAICCIYIIYTYKSI